MQLRIISLTGIIRRLKKMFTYFSTKVIWLADLKRAV